ncbi:hypothetical protein [Oceanobacillus sp. FSL H7-0719]|uniref:hypothetical protein n=1 Tax=Oceanobacillus sp. FSL H7-0719 TaxID=2954507 RepID=UPI00324ED5BA
MSANPQVYRGLADIAVNVNVDKAIFYAEKAVEAAEKESWNVEEYERWLQGIREGKGKNS